MSTSITVPKEYGYVVATVAGTFFLAVWHGANVTKRRKPAGIKYPKAYADSADMAAANGEMKKQIYLFNCCQRAHSNYLENQPSVIAAMLISGLTYPIAVTVMGIGWMVCRVLFAVGYTRTDREDGKGRMIGGGFWLFQLGLFGLTAWTGLKMAM